MPRGAQERESRELKHLSTGEESKKEEGSSGERNPEEAEVTQERKGGKKRGPKRSRMKGTRAREEEYREGKGELRGREHRKQERE